MIVLKIVGVCGSGKTTLATGLRARGYEAHQVSQEHSGVPDLWLRRHPADYLVFLDASNSTIRARYPHLDLTDAYLAEQRRRLEHARQHADVVLQTDDLTPDEVILVVSQALDL